MSISCPICKGMNSVQKVTAIVASGTSSGYYSGPTVTTGKSNNDWVVSTGSTFLSGSSSTTLANLLSPPPSPVPPRGIPLGCLIPVLVLSVGTFIDGGVLSYVRLITFCITMFVLYYHFNKLENSTKKHEHYKPLYQQAIQVWDRLYYCHKDDIVFDPGTGTYENSAKMQDYIFAKLDDKNHIIVSNHKKYRTYANIVIGIVGVFIGNWIMSFLGVPIGIITIPSLLIAISSAVVLLWVVGLLRR